MFWDKGYTPSQNIENLLQKENVTIEEFLDDEDILQECKSQKKNLIKYLTRPDVIKRLIELTITEPPLDVSTTERFKHANMACEILTCGLPSVDSIIVDCEEILQTLYSYLEKEPPLNPLLSSFFNKTFCMLLSKKVETDWFSYQRSCIQVLEFIKSRGNFLDLIFRHFATPVIMDLLHQIIKEVQGNLLLDLFKWLTEQKLVERLISMLGKPEEAEKHKNISEFLCELLRYGRSMRQKDQVENESFTDQLFLRGNPLLLSLEDQSAISQLVDVMLQPDAEETTVIGGVRILLALPDESIVYEPASDWALERIIEKEKDNYDKIISIIVEVVEPRVAEFHNLLLRPIQKNHIMNTYSDLPPPFGLTRLQICSLFTILVRIGNSKLIDAICKTDLFNTLLKLFKEYCWNNFLHSEVEKCLRYVFSIKKINTDNNNKLNIQINHLQQEQKQIENNDNEKSNGDTVENSELNPSALQTYAIVNCRVISKLIECWMLNKEMQSTAKGRRLGYMGHLIKIFDTITTSILESEQLGALIESNLSENELENWRIITNLDDGELIKDLNTQKKMLADCNAYESADFNTNLPKEFHNENLSSEFFNEMPSNLPDLIDEKIFDDLSVELSYGSSDRLENDLIFANSYRGLILDLQNDKVLTMKLKEVKIMLEQKDEEFSASNSNTFGMSASPWGADPFNSNNTDDGDSNGWNKSNNEFFADFDSHFNDFDLGITGVSHINNIEQNLTNEIHGDKTHDQVVVESDNNANFEKLCNAKISAFDDDDDNFELNNTKKNAEKIIDSIVNDDNSDEIIGDDGNGKMQTDEDDILVNKNDDNNSFNQVQAEVLDNTNIITINNSASNGPVNDELTQSCETETTDKYLKSSNYSNDHTASDNNTKSSTAKDISCNYSIANASDTKTTDIGGGCDDTASVAGESS